MTWKTRIFNVFMLHRLKPAELDYFKWLDEDETPESCSAWRDCCDKAILPEVGLIIFFVILHCTVYAVSKTLTNPTSSNMNARIFQTGIRKAFNLCPTMNVC